MIVVTGATGKLGSMILQRMLTLMPAGSLAASARKPEQAALLASAGVRVRQGDFAAPETLRSAFEGATQVLLVSSNAEAYGGDTMAQHRAAIEAAREAGATRIVYTSHMAASTSSAFRPMHNHAATEALLAESGLAWTALRNGFYADSGASIVKGALRDDAISVPADGKVSWTTHADLAAAAAAVLVDEGRFEGPTPPLTSAGALDMADLAEIATDLTGVQVERRLTPDETFRAEAIARGVLEAYADIQLGLFQAARAGEFAAVDPMLERLIGRAPIPMREVLAATLAG